jgi:hypothetical protein
LIVSKPELKARLVSAIETKMWWTAFKRCFQFQRAPLHNGVGNGNGNGHAAAAAAAAVGETDLEVAGAATVVATLSALRSGGPPSLDADAESASEDEDEVSAVEESTLARTKAAMECWNGLKVGRCKLTVSKPVLKARLVSALETKLW